jgi:hypothetical protein
LRARRIAGVALAILGGVVLVLGAVAYYARAEVLDPEAFADRATSALEDDGVRDFVAQQLVVGVIERSSPDVLAARPLLETLVRAGIDTEPFRRLFRRAAIEANRVLFERERESVAFELSDATKVLRFVLSEVAPDIGEQIPSDIDVALLELEEREFARESLAVADDVRLLGILLPILAVVLLVAAVVVAPDRRMGVLRAAVSASTAGAALALTMFILHERTIAGLYGADETTDEEIRAAGTGLLDAFFGDLFLWALALAFGGAVVAAAAAMLDPEDVHGPVGQLSRLGRRPAGRWGRALRGALLFAAGVFVALEPDTGVRVVALAVAALLLFVGAGELLDLLESPGAPAAESERARIGVLWRAGASGAAVVVATGLATLVLADSAGDPDAGQAAEPGTCNGSRELCEMRLDQVVFGGTHNSFSAADSPGWYIANQRRTIPRQLEDGMRLFLLDPHWGVSSPRGVSTDFESEGRDRNKVANALPPDTLAAAERLVGRIGLGAGQEDLTSDVWLCHTVCELGAIRMSESLEDIGRFLDENPGEVVVIFIEPYVDPAELERVFVEAGLREQLAELDPDLPLPTLGEMVEADRRVLVLTEKDADPAHPWYHDGFGLVQDTPLGAQTVAELSCELFRGGKDSPLLMLNHWADLFPPRAGANVPFLQKEEILDRAEKCERERGRPVNLIAVDHYDQGDLTGAVDELNAERIEELERAVAASERAAGER